MEEHIPEHHEDMVNDLKTLFKSSPVLIDEYGPSSMLFRFPGHVNLLHQELNAIRNEGYAIEKVGITRKNGNTYLDVAIREA